MLGLQPPRHTSTLPYLQGSFAIGDFDIYSDVDFLIVLEEDVSDVLLPELQSLHRQVFGLPSAWAQHLEGSYLPKAALRHLPLPTRKLLYLDHGRAVACGNFIVQMLGMAILATATAPAMLLPRLCVVRPWCREYDIAPWSAGSAGISKAAFRADCQPRGRDQPVQLRVWTELTRPARARRRQLQ